MTFREALQIEIWSKKTSRKLFKVFGICIAVGTFVTILEVRWITPSERSAARNALVLIEDLQTKPGKNDGEYQRCKEQADEGIENTERAAWTLRDWKMANAILGYKGLIEAQHDELKLRPALRKFQENHPRDLRMQSYQAQEDQQDKMSQQVIGFMHEVLHRSLD